MALIITSVMRTNCTHLLNVKMYQPCPSEIKKQIQQEVYRKINNVPIEYIYDGMNIIITWHCNDAQTNPKYSLYGCCGNVR